MHLGAKKTEKRYDWCFKYMKCYLVEEDFALICMVSSIRTNE